MRLALLSALLLLPSAALAQPTTQTIAIDLSNFKFTPSKPVLEHGRRYVLHLVNSSGGGHDLVAKAFFAAATLDPADRAKVAGGEVDLEGGGTTDIAFTAPPVGHYPFHCSHFMHSTFGMKGEFVVR